MKRSLCIAIVGQTASGKSSMALKVAKAVGGEILCMDSTTIYKGFDIGSSKPSQAQRSEVPHHLLDILSPKESFSAFDFVQKAEETIQEVESRGKIPIVTGGTYFYLRALQHGMYQAPIISQDVVEAIETEFENSEGTSPSILMHEELKLLDPESAKKIHPNDRYRLLRALAILKTSGEKPSELKPIPISEAQKTRIWVKYAMLISRHVLNQNIVNRTEAMLREGLLDEVRSLRKDFPDSKGLRSIGYIESCAHLDEKISEKQLRNQIIEHTRQFSKRQMTWLRSDSELRFIDDRDLPRIELELTNLRHALETDLPKEIS